MSRRVPFLLLRKLAGLLMLLWGWGIALAEEPVRAEIRFAASSGGSAWVGQGINLHLELWSDALSFSGQAWVLPQVPGAFLMQNESSALNLSERRQGVSWQGVRYSFQLYPQRPGKQTVPPFAVRFETRNGYGSKPQAWSFETPRLEFEARLPPGAGQDDLVLTTEAFSMKSAWSVPPDEGALELSVGDALRLTVEREADGVPGMVFTPLAVPDIPGLGVYADAPTVVDKNYRGTLTGTRRDVITFVSEQAGTYRIPGQSFTWWDPSRNELEKSAVPALELVVAENPAWNTATGATNREQRLGSSDAVSLAVLLLTVFLLALVAWKAGGPLRAWFGKLREKRRGSEKWAFQDVRKACSSGAAHEIYAAINSWLWKYRPGMTQLHIVESTADTALAEQLLQLQESVASGGSPGENGKLLYRSLRIWRRNGMELQEGMKRLPTLNPGAVKEC